MLEAEGDFGDFLGGERRRRGAIATRREDWGVSEWLFEGRAIDSRCRISSWTWCRVCRLSLPSELKRRPQRTMAAAELRRALRGTTEGLRWETGSALHGLQVNGQLQSARREKKKDRPAQRMDDDDKKGAAELVFQLLGCANRNLAGVICRPTPQSPLHSWPELARCSCSLAMPSGIVKIITMGYCTFHPEGEQDQLSPITPMQYPT